ncbi:MAG: HD domain-containing protein [Bacteroidota bacterium]
MNRDKAIKMAEEFVRQNLKGYDSGHDWWHIERVRRIAKFINDQEVIADPFTLDVAVLLHDVADSKFAGDDKENGYAMIGEFMDNAGLNEIKDQVIEVIRNVSFSNKNPGGNLSDPLLHVLQDADRLDAIGAIGIARAFNYGGFRNNIIYSPDVDQLIPSTISHFYEKLLVLKYRMNTLTAKRLAIERHEFLEIFLKQFYKEWEFGTGVRNA